MAVRRKVVAVGVAALAVGGTGAGIAATKLASSPSQESKAIVDDAARNLGVEPSKLSAAIKQALEDRVDAAVAAGRLTKQQGQELKQRIASDDFPLFGPPAFGPGFAPPHPFFHGLDAAAAYLGLTDAQLRSRLESGKTLAEVATAESKSVDGLKNVMLKDAQAKLDQAVQDGRLTKAQEQRALSDLQQRIDGLVDGKLQNRFPRRPGFGFRRDFDRQGPSLPPAA